MGRDFWIDLATLISFIIGVILFFAGLSWGL